MIATQYARAKALLLEKQEGHAQLAQILTEREVIFAQDVENIFGKRPWASRTEELLDSNSELLEEEESTTEDNQESESGNE